MKMLSEQYAVAYHSLNVQAAAEGYALTDEDRESLDEAVRQDHRQQLRRGRHGGGL